MVRIALLRGINVGTAKRVGMADLRGLFERLGCRNVRTLLNSGNVVFETRTKDTPSAPEIERAMARTLNVSSRVMMLTAAEAVAAVRGNPLAKMSTDPARLLITVLESAKTRERLEPLLGAHWAPEAIEAEKRVAYLWCANGIAGSPLWKAVNRVLGDECTARNLTTMTKLCSLATGEVVKHPRT